MPLRSTGKIVTCLDKIMTLALRRTRQEKRGLPCSFENLSFLLYNLVIGKSQSL